MQTTLSNATEVLRKRASELGHDPNTVRVEQPDHVGVVSFWIGDTPLGSELDSALKTLEEMS